MWTQLKGLNNLVEATISKKNLEGLVNLEAALKKHRPDFTDLLRNPVSCFEIHTFITM